MTRKEEIKEIAQKEMGKYPNFCITAPAFRMGAEWADQHPAWISVEDEMPPTDIEVLGCWNGEDVNLCFWNTQEQIEIDINNHNLTHWLPLPQPPKEGGQKL